MNCATWTRLQGDNSASFCIEKHERRPFRRICTRPVKLNSYFSSLSHISGFVFFLRRFIFEVKKKKPHRRESDEKMLTMLIWIQLYVGEGIKKKLLHTAHSHYDLLLYVLLYAVDYFQHTGSWETCPLGLLSNKISFLIIWWITFCALRISFMRNFTSWAAVHGRRG